MLNEYILYHVFLTPRTGFISSLIPYSSESGNWIQYYLGPVSFTPGPKVRLSSTKQRKGLGLEEGARKSSHRDRVRDYLFWQQGLSHLVRTTWPSRMLRAQGNPILPDSADCPALLSACFTLALAKSTKPLPGTHLLGWQWGKWPLIFNDSPTFLGGWEIIRRSLLTSCGCVWWGESVSLNSMLLMEGYIPTFLFFRERKYLLCCPLVFWHLKKW